MNNFEVITDLIQHANTKEQLAMLILQIIQQGKRHKLDNIEMVNYWLNKNADEVESEGGRK